MRFSSFKICLKAEKRNKFDHGKQNCGAEDVSGQLEVRAVREGDQLVAVRSESGAAGAAALLGVPSENAGKPARRGGKQLKKIAKLRITNCGLRILFAIRNS
jgi:hypothetical protein